MALEPKAASWWIGYALDRGGKFANALDGYGLRDSESTKGIFYDNVDPSWLRGLPKHAEGVFLLSGNYFELCAHSLKRDGVIAAEDLEVLLLISRGVVTMTMAHRMSMRGQDASLRPTDPEEAYDTEIRLDELLDEFQTLLKKLQSRAVYAGEKLDPMTRSTIELVEYYIESTISSLWRTRKDMVIAPPLIDNEAEPGQRSETKQANAT